jgi:Holliday junction resolvasome RuvABC endonuclease subunit
MFILGLDASTTHIGWALLNGERVAKSGELELQGRLPERIDQARAYVIDLIGWGPELDALAIEEPFYGRNARTAAALNQMLGALCSIKPMLATYHIAPAEAKLAATGQGFATKLQVQNMLRLQFGQSFAEHEADAVAVALAASGKIKLEALAR